MPIQHEPETLWQNFEHWIPFLIVLIALPLLHRVVWTVLLKGRSLSHEEKMPRQIVTIVVAVVGVIMLIVLLPSRNDGLITDGTKGALLGLVGLTLAGLMTLSSTTLASNAMAGLMLRMERGFRSGDFVRSGEYFGRVTERGLFHIEIQTEDRDLVTLPNMYLATNPVRVVRSSGTIISANVSLGYDVSHRKAQRLLKLAAEAVGLEEPFVWIVDLLDHAVSYRVCGFCPDVKVLVSVRSKLRESVLDTLHGAGVEIVSPSFMNQRPAPREEPMIPRPEQPIRESETTAPEALVFDKAEAAEHRERLNERQQSLETRLHELESELKGAKDEPTQQSLSREIEQVSHELADIDETLDSLDGDSKAGEGDSAST